MSVQAISQGAANPRFLAPAVTIFAALTAITALAYALGGLDLNSVGMLTPETALPIMITSSALLGILVLNGLVKGPTRAPSAGV